ncbi:sugar ABC transporter substrate-binding protein [Rhodococcus daqingensis]|uniref:Sugar ABC transporter substrate-binding protein n=1 Tax=Rhodococcus daqingensis TaxID=2479363 RepID=A0ABW2S5Z4_9NOCA
MLAAGLAACSSGAGAGSGVGQGEVTVAYSSPVMAQEAQQDTVFGLESAAESLGWTIKVYDANLSADAQVSNVQTMIDQDVSALTSWSLDAGAVGGVYSNAQSAGIPVIGMNSGGAGVSSSTWWAVNRCDPGGPLEQLAKMFAVAKPDMKIIIMGGPPVPSVEANTECFTRAAEEAGLDIIASQSNTQDTTANAAALAQDLLTAHSDVEAFWAYNDASALGISAAIAGSGRTVSTGTGSGIMVTGINGDAAAIDAIRQGRMTATIDANAVANGWVAVAAMRDAINGETEKTYVVDTDIIDGNNIADYIAPRERTYSLDDLPLVGR